MVGPRLDGIGDISLDGIAELASQFKASVTATAISTCCNPARSRRRQNEPPRQDHH